MLRVHIYQAMEHSAEIPDSAKGNKSLHGSMWPTSSS